MELKIRIKCKVKSRAECSKCIKKDKKIKELKEEIVEMDAYRKVVFNDFIDREQQLDLLESKLSRENLKTIFSKCICETNTQPKRYSVNFKSLLKELEVEDE